MNHVQVTVELSDGRNQLLSRQSLKPVGSRHSPEKLRGLRFYASDVAEMRTALGNIDGTKLSGPFVYVVEQDAMDLLQVREIVRRKIEIDGGSSDFGEGALSIVKRLSIGQA